MTRPVTPEAVELALGEAFKAAFERNARQAFRRELQRRIDEEVADVLRECN